jgi:hypothetical protein
VARPAASAFGQATPSAWRPVGFEGAEVYAMAATASGEVLYVATAVGLHTCVDGGASWLCADSNLASRGAPPVIALAADAEGRGSVYAGTIDDQGAGVYATKTTVARRAGRWPKTRARRSSRWSRARPNLPRLGPAPGRPPVCRARPSVVT